MSKTTDYLEWLTREMREAAAEIRVHEKEGISNNRTRNRVSYLKEKKQYLSNQIDRLGKTEEPGKVQEKE